MKAMSNFIIVGGQRCGTTWLYNALEAHPDIEMAKPVKPEPKYFLQELVTSKEYFKKFFSDSDNKVFGEKSTSYYENFDVPKRIKDTLPDSKILIITRNPIDRAISNYFFSTQFGLEDRTIEDVFVNNIPTPILTVPTSVNPFDYINRGFYSGYIKNYINIFGENKVKVLSFESIIANSHDYTNLLKFLNVDSSFILPEDNYQIINPSQKQSKDMTLIRQILRHIYNEEVQAMSEYIDTKYWNDFYKAQHD
jgi:hypothetical protein